MSFHASEGTVRVQHHFCPTLWRSRKALSLSLSLHPRWCSFGCCCCSRPSSSGGTRPLTASTTARKSLSVSGGQVDKVSMRHPTVIVAPATFPSPRRTRRGRTTSTWPWPTRPSPTAPPSWPTRPSRLRSATPCATCARWSWSSLRGQGEGDKKEKGGRTLLPWALSSTST